ncbi:MAG: hypothetical protein ACRDY3_03365 [Acidimicrobiales bacterium]
MNLVRWGVLAPTGHDRASRFRSQDADRPGSLHGILGQFADRNVKLTRLESRPTEEGLGDCCFAFGLAGHLADEVVGTCRRDLHAGLTWVKFPGPYPAGGGHAATRREKVGEAGRGADEWLVELRAQVDRCRTGRSHRCPYRLLQQVGPLL